jgi:hypothetical protein
MSKVDCSKVEPRLVLISVAVLDACIYMPTIAEDIKKVVDMGESLASNKKVIFLRPISLYCGAKMVNCIRS